MTNQAHPVVLLAMVLAWSAGCVSSRSGDAEGLPVRIGEQRDRSTDGMEPYEIAVLGLLDHLTDTVAVLEQVQDLETSTHAADLIDQARPDFVRLRSVMHEAEASRDISEAELAFRYGSTYLLSRYRVEEELDRIKAIGPEVYSPIIAAMKRLRQDLKDAGLSELP